MYNNVGNYWVKRKIKILGLLNSASSSKKE